MIRITLFVLLFLSSFCFFPFNPYAADRSVVVIPLNTKSSGPQELYVPASLFRPVTPLLGGTWQEDGSMLQPSGAGNWIAPLLLPTGATIVSLELYWKNNTYNTGVSSVVLHLFNLLNGFGAQTYTYSSNVALAGVQNVLLDTNDFVVTESLKPSILVYLSNSNRWLMGVKVVYK